jgi:hypothetical protein
MEEGQATSPAVGMVIARHIDVEAEEGRRIV